MGNATNGTDSFDLINKYLYHSRTTREDDHKNWFKIILKELVFHFSFARLDACQLTARDCSAVSICADRTTACRVQLTDSWEGLTTVGRLRK